jgi:hypothetical protein
MLLSLSVVLPALLTGCAAQPSKDEPTTHRSTLPRMGISYEWPVGFGTESRRGQRGRHRAHLRPDDPSLILGVLQFEESDMQPEQRVSGFIRGLVEGGKPGPLKRRDINGLPFWLQRSSADDGWAQVGLTRRNGLSLLGYSILTYTDTPARDAENEGYALAFFEAFRPAEQP